MREPQPAISPQPERLSWTEICLRYPDEWVVLVEIDREDEDNFEFNTAVVLGHSKGHNEVLRQTRPLLVDVMVSGIYFTGRVRAPVPRIFLP